MNKTITLKANKKYKICTCGISKTLPLCDDSHDKFNQENNTNFKSLKITPEEDINIEVSSSNWEKE